MTCDVHVHSAQRRASAAVKRSIDLLAPQAPSDRRDRGERKNERREEKGRERERGREIRREGKKEREREREEVRERDRERNRGRTRTRPNNNSQTPLKRQQVIPCILLYYK